jgi:prophage DNA circulation protein
MRSAFLAAGVSELGHVPKLTAAGSELMGRLSGGSSVGASPAAATQIRNKKNGRGGAARRRHLLTHQLRRTGSGRDRRRTAEELDETPQVLRGCSEQHLIFYSTQAAQSKSIELQDALHVGKSHLDLLAFAARLLERLRISKRANTVSHVLVDVSGYLSAGARRTLWLEFASRTVGPARPIG